jgi:hypothetical protein
MKHRVLLLASLALAGAAAAETPKKAPLSKYTRLWTDSPFTTKPIKPDDTPEVNILDDYALVGVSPIADGFRVTLMNKKTPDERIYVESGKTVEGFKILEVVKKAGDPLGTVVRMMSGSMTGTVAFDEKLLTLKTAAPPAAGGRPGQPGQPPQPGQPVQPAQMIQPGQAGQPGQVAPAPQIRPRVVPPPTAGGAPTPQNSQNNQGRPNTSGRPDRRGGGR